MATVGARLRELCCVIRPVGGRKPIQDDVLIREYLAGGSLNEVGARHGVDGKTVWYRLRCAGVPTRPRCNPWGCLYMHKGHLRTRTREGRDHLVHRGCWQAHYGAVPEGCDIHHISGDPLDNRIENLACLKHGEHTRLHAAEARKRAAS